jgi:hypothetical protein
MIHMNYQKRKNQELFKSLEESKSLFLSNAQNYIPIYNRFFSLNTTNYNSINLNHKWYLSGVKERIDEDFNLFDCRIKNIDTQKVKDKEIFFKMAPLLDPIKYLIGKYDIKDPQFFKLPDIDSTEINTNPKFMDYNNSAYVDGLFLFLSSNLVYTHNFINGVDYYGSFLAIKNDFKMNIYDDLEYLIGSDYFIKNKNVLFDVEKYDHIFKDENINEKLKPIKICHDLSSKSNISAKSFDNELFEDIFEDLNSNTIDLNDLKNMDTDLEDITNSNMLVCSTKTATIKSSSSCSSRTSYTSDSDLIEQERENEYNEDNGCQDNGCQDNECQDNNCQDNNNVCDDNDNDNEDNECDNYDDDEEQIFATIPKFPVQVICMENCENTFDNLIMDNELTKEEWLSAFMQIIMILISYQKVFAFTHNDLHTNNVMYIETERKFIYYCYKKKNYKVPTFGRIFKIIDFGRSIYKFNGQTFCSDSFKTGNDAATQYNTEPYFNEKKPRLEPNYSFDLCRLACSIFDHIIEDLDEIKDLSNCDAIKRLVVEWCLDDKGVNLLYKNNGMDRYPDFKLYKMIARCVHNHTPQAQLERPEFDDFSKFKGDVPKDIINIDEMSSLV